MKPCSSLRSDGVDGEGHTIPLPWLVALCVEEGRGEGNERKRVSNKSRKASTRKKSILKFKRKRAMRLTEASGIVIQVMNDSRSIQAQSGRPFIWDVVRGKMASSSVSCVLRVFCRCYLSQLVVSPFNICWHLQVPANFLPIFEGYWKQVRELNDLIQVKHCHL